MIANAKTKLARHRLGRSLLHLWCIARGGKILWHAQGVWRELFHTMLLLWCGCSFLIGMPAMDGRAFASEFMNGDFSEPYRPGYHFTPAKNWMNDPNGLVYYEGEYHLFYQYNPFGNTWGHMSWGHAVSPDMVHWKYLPVALAEQNGVMIFSGSAVVDWHNTSGFGKGGEPPLVAIYTGCRADGDGMQFQCIAFSNDRGRTWTKYDGNPVIYRGSRDFRDPKVQWYAPAKRWVMTVSLSAEHKVCFYGSADLKHWKLLSEFGPANGTTGVWECPDLFQLPVEGTNKTRWVLAVNMNPGSIAGGSGGQYFVGQFDGTRFLPDPDSILQPIPACAPAGEILADFEGKNYGDWKTTGNAFGPGPAQGRLENQNPVTGYMGRGLVDSYYHGDDSTGTLTSPPFLMDRPYLNFLIGGGSGKETRMDLLVDGKAVRSASGNDTEQLAWKSWDLHQFHDKKAVLQIVDNATGGWGHINVDQITLADEAAHPAEEAALWFDYGPDYYAAVSWSDIPKSDGRRLWLGWMSNWEYGQEVPTSPWRSAMSIPRQVALLQTDDGIRLIQRPVEELKSLRSKYFEFKGGDAQHANDWVQKNRIQGDHFELMIELPPENSGLEGVKVFKSDNEETVIGVDWKNKTVFADRTQSGNVGFNPQFPGIYSAPIIGAGRKVKLHIFADSCSVEVFVNDGERVLTLLAFPSAKSRGLEFFSSDGRGNIGGAKMWNMKSIRNHQME